MNQHLVSLFSIVKNEKVFQFMCGVATFDEVQEVLEQFKSDFEELKKQQEKQQEDELAKKALDSQEKSPEPESALEPEVVSGE